MSTPTYIDFKHRDWLLHSTMFRLRKIDSNISTKIVETKNQKLLIVENISEDSLPKLSFLVNTDSNNNYLYIQDFSVFLKDDTTHQPIHVIGLKKNLTYVWYNADQEAYENGDKYFLPFTSPYQNPISNEPMSVSGYVDLEQNCFSWTTKTKGKVKIYKLVLNPDCDASLDIPGVISACIGS